MTDIEKYAVDVFVMGDDWEGKFDDLRGLCDVVYLTRPSILDGHQGDRHRRRGRPRGSRPPRRQR